MEHFDLIIIGGGVAGYGTGIYAARYELATCIVEGPKPGGETATGGTFENYPGIVSIDGYELYAQFKAHAEKSGVTIKSGTVAGVAKDRDGGDKCFTVTMEHGAQYTAASIVFAHGQARRHLGLPNEEALTGKGVSYCATCDGPLYKGKTVGVVGGGDSSVKGVNLLAEYAEKIYLIVRGEKLLGEPVNLSRLEKKGDKVRLLLQTNVKELIDEGGKFAGVRLSKPHEGKDTLMLDGLFIEIGAMPDTTLTKPLGVALDEKGYIKVDKFQKTNVEGIFAAGDATDASGSFRQAITAAAQGSMAATSVYEFISDNPNRCPLHARPVSVGNS